MLVFPREIETHVYGHDGVIYFEQFDANGNRVGHIGLSVHQFEEIYNRSKSVIAEANEKPEDEE
jgi:hypothetical protein